MNGMKLAQKPEQDDIRHTELYTKAMSIYQNTYQRNYTSSQAINDAGMMSDLCNHNPNAIEAVVTATLDVLNPEKGRKPKELTLLVAGRFMKESAVNVVDKNNIALTSAIIKNVLPDLPTGIGVMGGRNELDIQVVGAILGALNELDVDGWISSNRKIALQKGYLDMISDTIDKLDKIAKRNSDAAKKDSESSEIVEIAQKLSKQLKETKA